ncbi:MAG: hypothetical protein V4671_28395 [Armatimonadota bacterium]
MGSTDTISPERGSQRRKAGRPRRSRPADKYTVALPPDLGEWAKVQPEGLSGLLEKLLAEEYSRRGESRVSENMARLTAAVSDKTLAKIWDTPEEDAAWAHL